MTEKDGLAEVENAQSLRSLYPIALMGVGLFAVVGYIAVRDFNAPIAALKFTNGTLWTGITFIPLVAFNERRLEASYLAGLVILGLFLAHLAGIYWGNIGILAYSPFVVLPAAFIESLLCQVILTNLIRHRSHSA